MGRKNSNPDDPRCPVLHDLAERLIATRRADLVRDQFRSGILSVFDTSLGVTVRLFFPENANRTPAHTLVYSYVGNYTYEERDGRMISKGRDPDEPYVVGMFDVDYADLAIDLIRRELVLDQLAEI